MDGKSDNVKGTDNDDRDKPTSRRANDGVRSGGGGGSATRRDSGLRLNRPRFSTVL